MAVEYYFGMYGIINLTCMYTADLVSVYNRSICKHYQGPPSEECYVSDDHLLDCIHQFLKPKPIDWVFTVLYVFVFVVGVTGNLLVCIAVWRNRHLRTTTNIFLVNLAVADFLVIILCLPPSYLQTIMETWFLGNAMCKIVEYYQTVSVIVSVMTLTAISVERWFAICRPLTFKETRRRVVGALVVIWITAHAASTPRLWIFAEKHDALVPRELTILLTSCTPQKSMTPLAFNFDIFMIVAFYILPILVMGFTYIEIARCLWSSTRTEQSLTEVGQNAMTAQVNARRRTAKMLIVVVIVFILCFLPLYVWNCMRLTDNPLLEAFDDSKVVTLFAHWMVYLNSSINPVIYNFMSGKFRKEFRVAFTCWFRLCARKHKKKHENYEMEPLSSRSGARYRVGEYDSSDVSRVQRTMATDA